MNSGSIFTRFSTPIIKTDRQYNWEFAQLLAGRIEKLLPQIDEIDTEFKPTIELQEETKQKVNNITTPLTESLTAMKLRIAQQAKQIFSELTNSLTNKVLLEAEQNQSSNHAIADLERQTKLLSSLNTSIQLLLKYYVVAIGSLDYNESYHIVDPILIRFTSVTIELTDLINSSFNSGGTVLEDAVTSYSKVIEKESLILQKFNVSPNETHIAYNILIETPCYQYSGDDEALYRQKQTWINNNYKKFSNVFTGMLRDHMNTLDDIQDEATRLNTIKIRWKNQLQSHDEISKGIKRILNIVDDLQSETADLRASQNNVEYLFQPGKKIELDTEINHNDVGIFVINMNLDCLKHVQQRLYNEGELLSEDQLARFQFQYQGILNLYLITVDSLDGIACEDVENPFSQDFSKGFIDIKDTNKTYKFKWNKSTETISVERDKTGIEEFTLVKENFAKWKNLEFQDQATSLKNKLTLLRVEVLLKQIDEIKTLVEPIWYQETDTMEKRFNDIKDPLLQSLNAKKLRIAKQADNIALELTKILTNNGVLINQQIEKHSRSMIVLQKQATLFKTISDDTLKMLSDYVEAAIAMNRQPTEPIYFAVTVRLTAVAKKIQDFMDIVETVEDEGTISISNFIQNEVVVMSAFANPEHHIHKTAVLLSTPPCYTYFGDANTQIELNQNQIKSDYVKRFRTYTNTLADDTKALENIQSAADHLNKWQNQIALAEEIDKLIQAIEQKTDNCSVLIEHFDKLKRLRLNLYNNGELLGDRNPFDEGIESLQLFYKNIKFASDLHKDIGSFLKRHSEACLDTKNNDAKSNFNKLQPVEIHANDEMKLRISSLELIQKLCHDESFLTSNSIKGSNSLADLAKLVADHKGAIDTWFDRKMRSTKSGEQTPQDLGFNNNKFRQLVSELKAAQKEALYKMFNAQELLEQRGEKALKPLVEKTEMLKESAIIFKGAAKKLKDNIG